MPNNNEVRFRITRVEQLADLAQQHHEELLKAFYDLRVEITAGYCPKADHEQLALEVRQQGKDIAALKAVGSWANHVVALLAAGVAALVGGARQ